MSHRTYTFLTIFIGVICIYVIVHSLLFPNLVTLRNAIVQGFFIGFGLAVVTTQILARIKSTRINGWITIFGCGVPGNGFLMRAACSMVFPGPVNVPQEAMYWKTNIDGAAMRNGRHGYVMHFPSGGLPPNDAFWSLTLADEKERFVENPINRYSVSDRSGLVPNADGSVDIYIQTTAPAGHESNWLPAPASRFILWLRVYMPGTAILNGEYEVPPVLEAK